MKNGKAEKEKKMNANYKSIILAISLFFALSASISAAPGDLDLTFGNGGIVITRGNSLNHLDYALGMAIQPDGKIVVVGDGSISGLIGDFAVVRYNPDGSLDASFGGGIVITPVGNSQDQARSVAIQADGKIVVAGFICNGVGICGASSLAVVRYNPNGSLDTSFNGTGKVINSASSGASDLAIQADGKIVVSGGSALFRYNTDGTPDTSFNGTGIVITQRGVAHSVAIQSDGKIVTAGGSQNSFAVARYHTDGSVDNSFNGTGIVITPLGNFSGAQDLAIQADGKIVVIGESRIVTDDFRTADFAVVRYNPNGSLDTSFGGTGKIIIPVGNSVDSASSVAIQPDGKIVAAGYSGNNIGSDFAVVRLNPNGSLDTTFNGTGKVITPITGGNDYAASVAIQADGKIVAAGGGDYLSDFYNFVVVRYQGNSNNAIPSVGLQYYPLPTPVRLLDTRPGELACDTPGTPLSGGAARTQAARIACTGIPANAQVVVGNATVVNTGAGATGGFITLYPSGAAQPTVSNLNYMAGQVVPNAFTVGLGGGDGAFQIYASSSTHFIVDVTGYYAPPGVGGLFYHPLPNPVRLLDTRSGEPACDTPGTPLSGGTARTQAARIACTGIPSSALVVVGNATVVNTEAGATSGFVTLYPSGATQPTVSNLNYVAGQVVPNAFTVGLGGGDGAFNIFATSGTHFIVDITGYYSDQATDLNGAGLLYHSLPNPVRLLDTRSGELACDTPGVPLIGNATRTEAARTACSGVASNAQAIVGNATVVNTETGAAAGFITLYPSGVSQPSGSNLNYVAGQVVPNAFTVGLSSGDGAFQIFASSSTHFIADLTGYFAP